MSVSLEYLGCFFLVLKLSVYWFANGGLILLCFEGFSSSYWLLEVGVYNLQSAKYSLRFCFSFPF